MNIEYGLYDKTAYNFVVNLFCFSTCLLQIDYIQQIPTRWSFGQKSRGENLVSFFWKNTVCNINILTLSRGIYYNPTGT